MAAVTPLRGVVVGDKQTCKANNLLTNTGTHILQQLAETTPGQQHAQRMLCCIVLQHIQSTLPCPRQKAVPSIGGHKVTHTQHNHSTGCCGLQAHTSSNSFLQHTGNDQPVPTKSQTSPGGVPSNRSTRKKSKAHVGAHPVAHTQAAQDDRR